MYHITERMEIEQYLRQHNVGSGDIYFHSGKTWGDRLTRIFTGSHWSHVGLIIRKRGTWYLLESVRNASPGILDIVSGKEKTGIRCVPLVDIVQNRKYEHGIRRLRTRKLTKRDKRRVYTFYKSHRHLHFEQNRWEMICAACCGNSKPNKSSEFCSEFIADIFKTVLGYKSLYDIENNYVPASFARLRLDDRCEYVWETQKDILRVPSFQPTECVKNIQKMCTVY